MKKFVVTVATASLVAGFAFAQDHSQHGAPAPIANPATLAFTQASDAMHRDMAIEYTGDADIDFVRGMIPHHQGAIDMARVVLEFGEDAEIRALAENIIAAQEAEIAWMHEWLENNAQ